jgi:lysophospholipase L1-like esterase
VKFIKTLFLNITVLLVLFIIIELIFGSWIFKKNHLKNLNIPFDVELKYGVEKLYSNNNEKITYSRDKYGLRGLSTFNHPEKIDILTIGGSTTDQRFIDDSETWQEILENNLKNNNINLSIGNAGVDGQSTIGHIKNFEVWFPYIPNLKPKYIFFYIGINDFFTDEKNYSIYDEIRKSNDLLETIKNNSAIHNLYRKIKGVYLSHIIELEHKIEDFNKIEKVNKGLVSDYDALPKEFYTKLFNYEKRIELLIKKSKTLGAEPIFITQPSRLYSITDTALTGLNKEMYYYNQQINGVDYYYINEKLNSVIKKQCAKNNLILIDLSNMKNLTDEDFYDVSHNTKNGAKKIGEEIAKQLIPLLKSKD